MPDVNVPIRPEKDKPPAGRKSQQLWILSIAVIVIGGGGALLVYSQSFRSTTETSPPVKAIALADVAPATEASAPVESTAPTAVAPATGDSAPANTTASAAVAPAVQVVMRNVQYIPVSIEVKQGGVVEWTNEDMVPHTVTSPSFNSGVILSGQSWRHTFTNTGNFPYACTFHPPMKGVVIIK